MEALWVLTNVSSGPSVHVKAVVEAGAVPKLVDLTLTHACQELRLQCLWCLSNIAGDGPVFRDLVLEQGAMKPLLSELIKVTNNNVVTVDELRLPAWTLSNFCRSEPLPRFEMTTVNSMLSVLNLLIHRNDAEVVSYACWTYAYLLCSQNGCVPYDQLQAVIDSGIYPRFIKLLEDPSKAMNGYNWHSSDVSVLDLQTAALRVISYLSQGFHNQVQSISKVGDVMTPLNTLQSSSPSKAIRKIAQVTLHRFKLMCGMSVIQERSPPKSPPVKRSSGIRNLRTTPIKKKTSLKNYAPHASLENLSATLNLRQLYVKGLLSDRATRKYLKSIL